MLGNIIEAQNSERKTRNQYNLLQKYDILMYCDVPKIVRKLSASSEAPTYYVQLKNVYNTIKRVHVQLVMVVEIK